MGEKGVQEATQDLVGLLSRHTTGASASGSASESTASESAASESAPEPTAEVYQRCARKIQSVVRGRAGRLRHWQRLHAAITVFSLLGGPGSGKGTLGAMLAAAHGVVHLSVGELLREAVQVSRCLTAATPMENPYCSCRRRHGLQLQPLSELPTAAVG